MGISKEFLWSTVETVVAELERADPQSVVGARVRGLLDARAMSTALQGDRHPRPPKSERDDKIAELYLGGLSYEATAKAVGCAIDTVKSALARRGIEPRRSGEGQKATAARQDEERIERIRQYREQGMTIQEIGDREGVSRERIRQICFRNGIDTTTRPLKPEERAAVDDYSAGASLIEVAEKHGVTRGRLRKWIVQCGGAVSYARRRRQRHPKTLADAEIVARLYRQGRSTSEIAAEIGCAQPSIYRLLAIAGVSPNRSLKREQVSA